jgi:hypothetical protein
VQTILRIFPLSYYGDDDGEVEGDELDDEPDGDIDEPDGDIDEPDGDAEELGDSEGEALPPPAPPAPPPLSPPPQAANKPPTRLSTKAKLKIFFFITPLSPIAARILIRSLIKIPHLLTFLKRRDRA